jgi:hypothetical protein
MEASMANRENYYGREYGPDYSRRRDYERYDRERVGSRPESEGWPTSWEGSVRDRIADRSGRESPYGRYGYSDRYASGEPYYGREPYYGGTAGSDWYERPYYGGPPVGGYFGYYGRMGQELGRPESTRGRFAGRGPKGYRRSDERIREDVNEQLTMNPDVDASDVEVRVANGIVTLSGIVEDRGEKRLAEDIAESVFGVDDVQNELKVRHGFLAGLTGEKAPEREIERAASREAETPRRGTRAGTTTGL